MSVLPPVHLRPIAFRAHHSATAVARRPRALAGRAYDELIARRRRRAVRSGNFGSRYRRVGGFKRGALVKL